MLCYKAVNPVGIEEGVKSLCEGGALPRFLLYNDRHSYLSSLGVDGVKGNNLICCMSHNSDNIFSALKSIRRIHASGTNNASPAYCYCGIQ
ncbi:hypothetical protein GUJ93_ZPchr0014g46533 [Zizania palustris]|uniref:Uncharacterized protein n=1 Tax=Zizania palustris TaxID=103762 RepID=A0A8J5T821_ZIZPA|nr:hypothetical protein GUJ93_ZPchr0014g46533 [Zizania palustris]